MKAQIAGQICCDSFRIIQCMKWPSPDLVAQWHVLYFAVVADWLLHKLYSFKMSHIILFFEEMKNILFQRNW